MHHAPLMRMLIFLRQWRTKAVSIMTKLMRNRRANDFLRDTLITKNPINSYAARTIFTPRPQATIHTNGTKTPLGPPAKSNFNRVRLRHIRKFALQKLIKLALQKRVVSHTRKLHQSTLQNLQELPELVLAVQLVEPPQLPVAPVLALQAPHVQLVHQAR